MKKFLLSVLLFCSLACVGLFGQTQILSVGNSPVNITTDQAGYNIVMVTENASTPTGAFTIIDAGRSPTNGFNIAVGGTYVFVNVGGNVWKNGAVLGNITAAAAGPYSVIVLESNVAIGLLWQYIVSPVSYRRGFSAGAGGGQIDCPLQSDGTFACLSGPANFSVNLSSTGSVTGGLGSGVIDSVGVDAARNSYVFECPNSVTGTVLNKPVILTASGCQVAAGNEVDGVLGICMGNCGTSGNAQVAFGGEANCIFVSGITLNHYVQNGTGGCVDSGNTTYPTTGGQVLGIVTLTAALGTREVELSLGQHIGGGSGGSLSTLTAAGGSNTLANGNNPQTWNWALTTDALDGLAFGETSAATNGTLTNGLANQEVVSLNTATNSTATPLEVAQGSITNTVATPAMQIETTWNNAGLTGEGLLFNVTNTSSAAASKIIDFRVGNTSEFTVLPTGLAVFGAGTAPTVGTAGGAFALEGTAPTGTSTNYGWYNDSTLHCFDIINQTTNVGCAAALAATNTFTGVNTFKTIGTATNCSSSASPAVCGSAMAGSVALPTGTNPTLQVNTSAVTSNSQIFLNVDEGLGAKLGVTCNTTLTTLLNPVVTARSNGVSFTFTIGAVITVNPACVSYMVVN